MNDTDQLRAEALRSTDELLAGCAMLRTALRDYESLLRKVRRRTSRATGASPVREVPEFVSIRAGLTSQIVELENRRRAWRITMFRLQEISGAGFTEIARDWGVSRQLVTRLMREGR